MLAHVWLASLAFELPPWLPLSSQISNHVSNRSPPSAKHALAQAGLVAAGLVTTLPALADDSDGAALFAANCAACHVGGQNVIVREKTLEKEALQEYLAGGFNEAAVVKQVTNGKNAMPAFGGRLSEQDIANVASFVISTSTAGWD
jgi:cytochrome c6